MPFTTTATVEAASQLDLPEKAPASFDNASFFWSYTEEPHRTRRQAIIKAHPEVRRDRATLNVIHNSLKSDTRSPSSAGQSH